MSAPRLPQEVYDNRSTAVPTARNLPRISLAEMSRPGVGPAAAIAESLKGVGTIRVPNDTPPYYVTVEVSAYSRKSWREIGRTTVENVFVLPLPAGLIDVHRIEYELEELGWIGGAAMNAASTKTSVADAIKNVTSGDAAKNLFGEGALDNLAAAGGVLAAEKLGGAAGAAASGFLGAVGVHERR